MQTLPVELLELIYLYAKSPKLFKTCRRFRAIKLDPVIQSKRLLMKFGIWTPAFQLYDHQPSCIPRDAWIDLLKHHSMNKATSKILLNIFKGKVFIENLLLYSVGNSHMDVVNEILKHPDFHSCDTTAAIARSCIDGSFKIGRLLVKAGADLRFEGDACLRLSAKYGNFGCVQLCIDNGAEVHAAEDDALLLACHNGYFEIAKLLLDNGSHIGAQNGRAIQWASEYGHIKIVLLLLSRGAEGTK